MDSNAQNFIVTSFGCWILDLDRVRVVVRKNPHPPGGSKRSMQPLLPHKYGRFWRGMQGFSLGNMKRLVSIFAFFANLTFGQPEQAKFVSVAFGNVKLYESGNSGVLTFTVVNGMPSTIEQYVIEVWSTKEHGPPVGRSCVIDVDHATIPPHSTVTLPNTCTLLSDHSFHASRIIAMRLANGWKWHSPVHHKLAK